MTPSDAASKADRKAARAAAGIDSITILLAHLTENDSLQLLDATDTSTNPRFVATLDGAAVRAKGVEEYVAEHHGGALPTKWVLRIRHKASGTYGKQCTIALAGDPSRAAARTAAAASVPAGSPGAGPWFDAFKPIIVAGATAFGTILAKKLLETPPPPNTLDDVAKVAALFNNNKGGDVTATLALVQAAEARGMALGKQLADAQNAGDRGGDSLADVARELVPPVLKLMSDSKDSARSAAPAGAVHAPPAAAAAPAAFPEGYAWIKNVVPYAASLAKLAAETKDPKASASEVIDLLPGPLYRAIEAVVKNDDFVAVAVRTFTSAAPDHLAGHTTWLTDFFGHARLEILEDLDDAPPA